MIRQIPEWGSPNEWDEINYTLDHLICRYKNDISLARDVAMKITTFLEAVFPVQEEMCLETCIHCPEPCCLNATVWFDFKDLLYFHLTDRPVPDNQLIEKQGDVCRYSSPRGCRLPRLSRPWTCTLYLCPLQKERLRSYPEDFISDYDRKIGYIKKCRKDLENLFLGLIT